MDWCLYDMDLHQESVKNCFKKKSDTYSEPSQTSKMKLFAKRIKGCKTENDYFHKNAHLRYLTGF